MKKSIWILLIVVIVAGYVYVPVSIERFCYYQFDTELWLGKKTDRLFEDRYYMAKFLIDKKVLVGKKSADIISILGSPDQGNDSYMLYDLGPERGSYIRINNDWLEIRFDESGNFISARIRPD